MASRLFGMARALVELQMGEATRVRIVVVVVVVVVVVGCGRTR